MKFHLKSYQGPFKIIRGENIAADLYKINDESGGLRICFIKKFKQLHIGSNLIFTSESRKFEEKRLIHILKIRIDILRTMSINKRSKYIDLKYTLPHSFILFTNHRRRGSSDRGVSEARPLVREWYHLSDTRNMFTDS